MPHLIVPSRPTPQLYDPVAIFDTFTDTAGLALASHTPDIGGAWSASWGAFQVNASGKATCTTVGTTPNIAVALIECGLANFRLNCILRTTVTTSAVYVMFRASDHANGWLAGFSNGATGTTYIIERNAGTPTIRAQATGTGQVKDDDYAIEVICNGSTIEVNCADTTLTYTSSSMASNTKVGLRCDYVGQYYDQFCVVPL